MEEQEAALAKLDSLETDSIIEKADAIIEKADLEAVIETFSSNLNLKMEAINSSLNSKMESMYSDIELLFDIFRPEFESEDGNGNFKSKSIPSPPISTVYSHYNANQSDDIKSNENDSIHDIPPMKILEFPAFNGANPRDWVLETIKYFNNYPMADSDKVDLAIYCMEGKAYIRLNEDPDMLGGEKLSWSELVDSILLRFSEYGQNHIIVDFHQLRQQGSFDDYLNIWMDLKAVCSVIYPDLDEKYYIRCFIGGLKAGVRSALWLSQPTSLDEAINLAQIKEQDSEIARRAIAKLKSLEPLDEIYGEDYAEISFNSLTYFTSYQNIHLTGKVGKEEIRILIDLCSSHSFIKEWTANYLRCRLKETSPALLVTSPIGCPTVYSYYECRDFSWTMKGNRFKTDVHVYHDLGCDLVLGLNWLKMVGPIELDFKTMELTVFVHGKPVVLTSRKSV